MSALVAVAVACVAACDVRDSCPDGICPTGPGPDLRVRDSCPDGICPTGSGQKVAPSTTGRFSLRRGLFGSTKQAMALGDCDGDGLLDVYAPMDSTLYLQKPAGVYTPSATADFNASPREPARHASFIDLDRDGNLDLVVGRVQLAFYRGHGDCTFDPPQILGRGCEPCNPTQLLLVDLDLDGLTDISTVCDCSVSAPIRFLYARGDGTFEGQVPTPTPADLAGSATPLLFNPFGTYYDDVDGDGALDLFALFDTGRSWFSWGVPGATPGFQRDDRLSELVARVDGMAVCPIDFDRDGEMDYYVSGTALLWNRGRRSVLDVTGYSLGAQQSTFSCYATDLDMDGWSDLVVVRSSPDVTCSKNNSPAAVYLNQHDGTFVDRADSLIGEGMAAESTSCGDLASDGHIGCFVADNCGVSLLQSRLAPQGGWIGLRLRGTVSSPEATGARVSLDGEVRPEVVLAGAQSPTWSEHDRAVLLAIGQRPTASVTITWPSGLVQHAGPFLAGTYTTVDEPAALGVFARTLSADGKSTVEVTVDPRLAGASAATIERSGAGTWVGPATTDPTGRVHRLLQAPASPGQARIEARLDGMAMRVRPRVRFQ